MEEFKKQIESREKRRIASFPKQIEPPKDDYKQKIKQIYEREKRTKGIKQYMKLK